MQGTSQGQVVLGRFGALAKDTRPVVPPSDLRLDVLGPADFGAVVDVSPLVAASDLAGLDHQTVRCVVACDGGRIVASAWTAWGDVHVPELARTIEILPGQHLVSRAYVDPAYRGQSLLGHLLRHYAARQAPHDELWALIGHDDVAALTAVERVGWTWTGDYWARTVLGRTFGRERRFGARRPLDAAR